MKKSHRDRVRDQLSASGVKFTPLDYDIWGGGVPLKQGREIQAIAKTAAHQLVELVDKSRPNQNA